jgi:lipoprotein-anchoring transpeptidase ErfK/SrfK
MSALLPTRRVRLFAGLWLTLLCASLGLIVFFSGASPASASIGSLFVSPTPTEENLWAYADLPKPTYTPAPTTIPADTPGPAAIAATSAPGSISVEIVDAEAAPADGGNTPDGQPASANGSNKYILVDISEQHLYAYEGDALVYSFVASTGIENSTRVGTFAVQTKMPTAYASTWDLWMPNWLGIYYSHGLENGIHALPILSNGATLWEGFLGRPVSYGCVVLGTYESQLLYDWSEIGTTVEIQW